MKRYVESRAQKHLDAVAACFAIEAPPFDTLRTRVSPTSLPYTRAVMAGRSV